MSAKLTEPATSAIDRPIPWTSRAKFIEMGRDGHLSGNLRDCLAAYRALSPDRRGMAMIISDVLVPTCRGAPAVRKLEPRDMDCLLEAYHANERGGDDGGTDPEALPAVIEPSGPRL
jgi:hypothetical protein